MHTCRKRRHSRYTNGCQSYPIVFVQVRLEPGHRRPRRCEQGARARRPQYFACRDDVLHGTITCMDSIGSG